MFYLRCSAALALVAAGVMAACNSNRSDQRPGASTSSSDTAAAASPTTIQITTKDFAFDAPAKIPAGLVTMRLANHGKELHHAQVVKLEEGKTIEDLAKAVKTAGPPPSWVKFVGGPNAVVPGKEANATAVLEPGRYAYLCFIFGPDRVLHANKGMIREFEVTDSGSAAQAELPPADVTVKLVDYDFEFSQPLTAGRRTIRVENAGPQPHELALLRLAPGKTVEDFAHWAEGGLKGAPPAEPIGGIVFLDKGGQGTFTADLTAGNYGLICFVPDVKDGKPHLAHGMMQTIKVG
jgi:hypothetical protein